MLIFSTRQLSLEVARATLAIFLADREFSASRYLFTVSNSGLLFLDHKKVGNECLNDKIVTLGLLRCIDDDRQISEW